MLSLSTIAKVVVNVSRTSRPHRMFDTGLILTPCTNFTEAKRLLSFTSAAIAVTALQNAGFTSSDDVYKATIRYFGAFPTSTRLMVSCFPNTGNNAETYAEALAKVLDKTNSFYGIYAAGVSSASDYVAIDTYIRSSEHTMVQFVPAVGTVDSAVDDGSVMDLLHEAESDRSMVIYLGSSGDTSQAAAFMGMAMGLQASHADSSFMLCYQKCSGVSALTLSQEDVDDIQDLNGNVQIFRGYTHVLFEKGTMASGIRYDDILYLDMIANALQEEAISMIAESGVKLPQTDDSTAQFINRFGSILMGYTERNILATGKWRGLDIGPLSTGDYLENGYKMWADSYDMQSDADRAARKAMPINVALNFAGAIESIVISINVLL